MKPKRVAILGAGGSGLVAIKICIDEGLTPVCFEKTSDIGGLWNYNETVQTGMVGVMKSTILNSSKEMMSFSDFTVPETFPNFMHHTKVLEYFKLYCKTFNLDDNIRFHHEVRRVDRTADFNETGEWMVEYYDLNSADTNTTTEVFQAVMLCTGHFTDQFIPTCEGEKSFKGKMVHTRDYKDPRDYEDQHVVVVGAGNSGGDVAVELSKISKQVYLSTRRGTWVENRLSKFGIPFDLNLTKRFTNWSINIVGKTITNKLIRSKLNQHFDHNMFSIEPEHEPLSATAMINDELPYTLLCGAVTIKPNIRSFTRTGVIFDDGSHVHADTIIYATGYTFGFPYLEEGIVQVKDNTVNLYKQVFPPDLRPATLAVIGCVIPAGSVNPISELQSRWACRIFKRTTQLPTSDEMRRAIEKRRMYMASRYVASPRYSLMVDWIPFMDDIAKECGAKPNIGKLLVTDPALAFQVVFGPCTPYQYRLTGPGAWPEARDTIMSQWERVYKPLKTRQTPVVDGNGHFLRNALLLLVASLMIIILLCQNNMLQITR